MVIILFSTDLQLFQEFTNPELNYGKSGKNDGLWDRLEDRKKNIAPSNSASFGIFFRRKFSKIFLPASDPTIQGP